MLDRMKPITWTILTVWLIARYYDSQNIYYKIDALPVHFIIWQFIYLMCKWQDRELQWSFFILQQTSCCISTAMTPFFVYDIVCLYLSFQFIITSLWMLPFYDTQVEENHFLFYYDQKRLYIL